MVFDAQNTLALEPGFERHIISKKGYAAESALS